MTKTRAARNTHPRDGATKRKLEPEVELLIDGELAAIDRAEKAHKQLRKQRKRIKELEAEVERLYAHPPSMSHEF